MPPRTRLAPTPSGFLHAGNAVAFLLTARFAERMGARIRLRIDDLDAERLRDEYVRDIFDSLRWLGIEWQDGPLTMETAPAHSQQFRLGRYNEAVALLKEQGDLYACSCSRALLKELERKGRRDCGCRTRALPFDGPESTWRLHLPADAFVRLQALVGTEVMLSPATLMPDPVIRQRPSLPGGPRPSYQIASLCDDVDYGTTFIVRGEDLLPSTACQLYVAERLGMTSFLTMRFIHHPLITDAQGRKLSKSEGAESLQAMRKAGLGPEALKEEADRLWRSFL